MDGLEYAMDYVGLTGISLFNTAYNGVTAFERGIMMEHEEVDDLEEKSYLTHI